MNNPNYKHIRANFVREKSVFLTEKQKIAYEDFLVHYDLLLEENLTLKDELERSKLMLNVKLGAADMTNGISHPH